MTSRPLEPLPGSPEPPHGLKEEYAAWNWQVVWQYGPEVITYRLSSGSNETRFLKLSAGRLYPSLQDESARMIWAADHLPVPEVIHHGSQDDVSWLLTRALPGTDATDTAWTADPPRLVRTLAAGLRLFHTAPVEHCPFDFRIPAALTHVRRRLKAGQIDADRDFHPEFAHLSVEEAVNMLEDTRPGSEDLAVCHGDYCLPNIIVDAGVARGFVDLGELGVADRWWDLAVATWSLTWNLGAGYEELFLREYGIELDQDRLRFYRLLYDLSS